MKLKNFQPSATLRVGVSILNTMCCDTRIEVEGNKENFGNEVLLACILKEIQESGMDFVNNLSEYFDVKTVEDALNLDCDEILKTLKMRPCVWCESMDSGDEYGFDLNEINELHFNFTNQSYLYGYGEIKFEREVSCGNISIGKFVINIL